MNSRIVGTEFISSDGVMAVNLPSKSLDRKPTILSFALRARDVQAGSATDTYVVLDDAVFVSDICGHLNAMA